MMSPRRAVSLIVFAAPLLVSHQAAAADPEPIRIGVISEQSAIVGQAILQGAQIAADDINAKGGVDGRKIEIIGYDDHSSASDAVRAFQRAVQQDHVVGVVTTFISEVALAIEPWAARLHVPTMTPAAASDLISKQVHDKYAQYKYMFQAWFPSPILGQGVCDATHDIFAVKLHMKTAAVVSEDADWTNPLDQETIKCLPGAGLSVVDHVRFNPDTTDFTPIYNGLESKHPDVIITGFAHVGLQPTVQWHDQQVPIALGGINSQATNLTFWKDSNGAVNGLVTQTGTVPGLAITPLTVPVADEFQKRFHVFPAFDGFTSYDSVRIFADAIGRAHSTDADKMVVEMEKTNLQGTLGTIAFYGPQDQYTHAMKYGPGFVTSVFMQWQNGKQVCIWPEDKCPNPPVFPSFVKLPEQAAAK